MNNHYSTLEYLKKRSDRLRKDREDDAHRIAKKKIVSEILYGQMADNKPDPKAYAKFKQEPYPIKGGTKYGKQKQSKK